MLTHPARLRSHPAPGLLALIVSLACLWCSPPSTAQAQLMVAGDLDLVRPVAIDDLGMGGSVGLRLGTEWQGTSTVITPELGISYARFTKRGQQAYPPGVFRGVVGVRVGFLLGLTARLGLMAHFGVGYVQWSKHWYEDEFADGASRYGYQDLSHPCFAYDAGVFLDFLVSWTSAIGLHVAYNRVSDDRKQIAPLDWLQFGLHGSVVSL